MPFPSEPLPDVVRRRRVRVDPAGDARARRGAARAHPPPAPLRVRPPRGRPRGDGGERARPGGTESRNKKKGDLADYGLVLLLVVLPAA